jgi:hypothetical protein
VDGTGVVSLRVSLASCFGPFRHSHLAHLTKVVIIKCPVEDGEPAAQG